MDEHSAHLRGKNPVSLLHVGEVSVDVQMVGIHRGYGRYVRMQLVEGAVELIGLCHHHRIVAYQQVCAVVAGDASKEGRAAFSAMGEDVGHQG